MVTPSLRATARLMNLLVTALRAKGIEGLNSHCNLHAGHNKKECEKDEESERGRVGYALDRHKK